MGNLPLFLLSAYAVPFAIYRSQRRWKTFLLMVASWFLTLTLAVVIGAFFIDADRIAPATRIMRDCATLVAVITCVWHSQRTRKAATTPVPPSVII
jgi:hypothetical protein